MVENLYIHSIYVSPCLLKILLYEHILDFNVSTFLVTRLYEEYCDDNNYLKHTSMIELRIMDQSSL